MNYVIHLLTGDPTATSLPSWMQSLIVSILSLGTFLGALISADIADRIGRRNTIIASCFIFAVGAILQIASTTYKLLVGGRLVAGLG
jgi:MFS transporter, SP family, sugar:H+ symporter